MINRKERILEGSRTKFWNHYFSLIQMIQDGNPFIAEKVKKYMDEENLQKRHYTLSNIPEKFFDFDFETIKASIMTKESNIESINTIEKYMNGLDKALKQGIGLYIFGPHGVAKTTIATLILKKAISKFYRCFFNKSTEILEFARAGWKDEEARKFFDYINNNTDFLVIDDVARLFEVTDNERLHIDKIFTRRDEMNLPTIITSNHDFEKNRELFGDALYSNFRERLILVQLENIDYRDKIGNSLISKL